MTLGITFPTSNERSNTPSEETTLRLTFGGGMQQSLLEIEYLRNGNPTSKELQQMAARLSLLPSVVENWFTYWRSWEKINAAVNTSNIDEMAPDEMNSLCDNFVELHVSSNGPVTLSSGSLTSLMEVMNIDDKQLSTDSDDSSSQSDRMSTDDYPSSLSDSGHSMDSNVSSSAYNTRSPNPMMNLLFNVAKLTEVPAPNLTILSLCAEVERGDVIEINIWDYLLHGCVDTTTKPSDDLPQPLTSVEGCASLAKKIARSRQWLWETCESFDSLVSAVCDPSSA